MRSHVDGWALVEVHGVLYRWMGSTLIEVAYTFIEVDGLLLSWMGSYRGVLDPIQ